MLKRSKKELIEAHWTFCGTLDTRKADLNAAGERSEIIAQFTKASINKV
jgi:hypothetical protein